MKYTPVEYKDLITEVVAVPVGKKTRIDIILSTNERITIMKGSSRKPVMVQLYDSWVNGNGSGTSKYFTFAKKVESFKGYIGFENTHLKSFVVNYNPARHAV